MDLTPREKDKLLVFTAALVAERRLARGLRLNYPEAAFISAAIIEGARRDGWQSERYGMTCARRMEASRNDLEIQVEATFPTPPSSSRSITRSHDSRRTSSTTAQLSQRGLPHNPDRREHGRSANTGRLTTSRNQRAAPAFERKRRGCLNIRRSAVLRTRPRDRWNS
jgi:urease subunit gamma